MKNEQQAFRITTLIVVFTFIISFARPLSVYAQEKLPVEPSPTAEVTPPVVEPPAEPTTEPAPEPTPVISEVLAQLPQDTGLVVLSSDGEPLPLASEEALKAGVTGSVTWCPNDKLPGDASCTIKYFSLTDLIAGLSAKSGVGTVYISNGYNAPTNNDADKSINFDQTALSSLGDLAIQGGWNFSTNALDTATPYSALNFGTGSFTITNWTHNVALSDILFTGTTGGIYETFAVTGTGNVSLDNVDVTESGSQPGETVGAKPGFIINTDGDVSITDSSFISNLGSGLMVTSGGDVTLDGVTANWNAGDGANIDTCNYSDTGNKPCTTTGQISISGYNTFSNNDASGMVIHSGGLITEADTATIYAESNDNIGMQIWRDGTTTTQPISLLGANTFITNMSDGLLIYSNQDITINDLIAQENGGTGASIHSLFASDPDLQKLYFINNAPAQGLGGTLTLTGDNLFEDNADDGLAAFIDGSITAENLTATNSGRVGVLFASCPGFYATGDMYCYSLPDTTAAGYNLSNYDVSISGGNFLAGNQYAGLAVATLGSIDLGTSDTDSIVAWSTANGSGADLQTGSSVAVYNEMMSEWQIDDSTWWDGGNITLNGNHLYGGYDYTNSVSLGNTNGLVADAWNDTDSTYGNVTMNYMIEASYNSNGIVSCASGNVSLAGLLSAFFNNSGDGVYVHCAQDVTIQNAMGSSNNYGIEVEGTDGVVTISDSVFTENTFGGVYLYNLDPDSTATLSSVTSTDNGQNGLVLNTVGDVEIADSDFSGNANHGLFGSTINSLTVTNSAFSSNGTDHAKDGGIVLNGILGDVSISGIEAIENLGQGILLTNFAGNIDISDSDLSGNEFSGIYLGSEDTTSPQITITNVTSSSNGSSGIYANVVSGDGSMTTLNCSSFSSNGSYGVELYNGVDATLAGVEATANGTDLIIDYSGTIVTLTGCIGVSQDKPVVTGPTGHIVPVVSGQSVPVECGYGFTSLVLESGETALFEGFCGSDAAFSQVESGSLPGALTEGRTFISAFTETVDGSTDGIIPDGGSAELNLAAGSNPSSLAVLYWDAGAKAWVEIPVVGSEGSFSASNPAYKVLTGVTYTADGTARFSVNFTGTFVVVQK
jgi:hypothetical protein